MGTLQRNQKNSFYGGFNRIGAAVFLTRFLRIAFRALFSSPGLAAVILAVVPPIAALGADSPTALPGRVVAAGLPGASGISAIGKFHPGGPIYDKPAFRAFTNRGAILDPERILVASTSNFGAPVANSSQPAGAILSIDPSGKDPIVVPSTFAAAGGQVRAMGDRVVLFTANSPGFRNGVYNSTAVTSELPAVANPTAIALNNAFGRVWVTSMPLGLNGNGIHSILDPDGRPLDAAPNKIAGGVFTGALTNRVPQLINGSMTTGAIATALLGRSPDGGGRAVFAGLNADGSLVQIHTEAGLDGLAPSGTVKQFDGGGAPRAGIVLNWIPNPILYVTGFRDNSIFALSLRADDKIFRVEHVHRIAVPELDLPVDIAPAIPEVVSSIFSSNKTLAGEADFYVVNRGSGTVVRFKQNGTVVAVRRVALPGSGLIRSGLLNGIAISSDARRIWLTVNGTLPGYPEGAVIEVPAFGAPDGSIRQ